MDGTAYGHKRSRGELCPKNFFFLSQDRHPSVRVFFFSSLLPGSSYLHFFYRKTSSKLDAMRDTNTRKEISLSYKLRPRNPKFRKKGSGNNKTGGTSCTIFHIRKKTDLRKKGVNGGPAKGDTFHFESTRGYLSPKYTS